MSQLDDLQTYVNNNMPLRPTLLDVSNTGYDGDPNGGGAPTIFSVAPDGTFYLRGNDQFYQKQSGTWNEVGASAGGVSTGAIALTIDPDDVTAVNPGADDKFTNQAEVDAFLTANGTTVFKNIIPTLNALALVQLKGHTYTINLAGTTHFVDEAEPDSSWGFPIPAFLMFDNIFFAGATLSSWSTVVSAQTLTAYTPGQSTYLDVSGTPYTGLDLRGKYAVIGSAYAVISANTASRLYIRKWISPAPTIPGDSVTVMKPATVLRNAKASAPTTRAKSNCLQVNCLTPNTILWMTDLEIQGMGVQTWVVNGNTHQTVVWQRVLQDFEYQRSVLGRNPSGRAYNWSRSNFTMFDCSIFQDESQTGSVTPIWVLRPEGFCTFNWGYINARNECTLSAQAKMVLGYGSGIYIFNNQWAFVAVESSSIDIQYLAIAPIIVVSGQAGGMQLWSDSRLTTPSRSGVSFENCGGPCIELRGGAYVDMSEADAGDAGLLDGGGNTDVGIKVIDPGSRVLLDVNSDVAGSLGDIDVRGVSVTHAELGSGDTLLAPDGVVVGRV